MVYLLEYILAYNKLVHLAFSLRYFLTKHFRPLGELNYCLVNDGGIRLVLKLGQLSINKMRKKQSNISPL